MTILFVGSFPSEFSESNVADSAAGNQVQAELIASLREVLPHESLYSFALRPIQSWPKGPLLVRAERRKEVVFPTVVNLPLVKTAVFAIQLFLNCRRLKPAVIVKYNVTFGEAIVLRVLKALDRHLKVALIMQDVEYPQPGGRAALGYLAYLGARLAAGFDLFFPVTEEIMRDFRFPTSRSFVFPGGISRQTRSIIAASREVGLQRSEPTAVFAGALEPYNGIDYLVDYWQSNDVPLELLVFGKGSLGKVVQDAAKRSKKIRFMGYVTEEQVTAAQTRASVNFCLRYSRGLTEGYFFPSKFFNVSAARGYVICNRFNNFPPGVEHLYGILADDLSNMSELLDRAARTDSRANQVGRIAWLEQKCQWSAVAERIRDELFEGSAAGQEC